jgi:hypothetical protein
MQFRPFLWHKNNVKQFNLNQFLNRKETSTMIKLAGHIAKKVPGSEKFSSDSFSASLELEVADQASSEDIRQRIREMYEIIGAAVNEQIAEARAKDGRGAQQHSKLNAMLVYFGRRLWAYRYK